MIAATRSDIEIQHDVLAELDWDPEVEAIEFNATVEDGIVTLTGLVDSYARKLAAERAALRVAGVRAVANDLAVVVIDARADTDVARAVADKLAGNLRIPRERIDVTVKNGLVTLTGDVDWDYQRAAAVEAVRDVAGVRDVVDRIAVTQPHVTESEVKAGIERALVRSAEVEADRINVCVKDSRVVLTGIVRTSTEKREARDAALRARGVTQVTNLIEVERPWG